MSRALTRDRLILDKIKADPRFATKPTPTLSYLRVEVPITNDTETLVFLPAKNDNGSPRKTERLLSVQDSFWSTEIGLFLLTEETAKPGTGVLFSYPNPVELLKSANAPADVVASHFNTIYNGRLEARMEQSVIFENMDTARFYHVPQTQLSAISDTDQFIPGQGFQETEPQLIIDGQQKTQITVTIPTFSGRKMAATKSGWENRLVLYVRGYLIPGSAKWYNAR